MNSKKNAASVVSNLGGGNHGHLGLVLNAVLYALVSATAYVRPVHPGDFAPTAGATTQLQIDREFKQHTERVCKHRESIDLELALKNQLEAAIEEDYIYDFLNPVTKTLDGTLVDILDELFETYGIVPPETLDKAETQVKSMDYQIQLPLNRIFNQIEDLNMLSIAALNPYTAEQRLTIALTLIKKSHDFERGLETWYAHPVAEHTWVNLKDHFRAAHRLLKKV